jgi:hypothetical protein
MPADDLPSWIESTGGTVGAEESGLWHRTFFTPPSSPQSPPPPEPYDETVHIDEYGVVRAQPSSARRTESFRSYSSRASSRQTTPRSNPYWDDDSYSYDPSGSQAPALSRVPSNASNYSFASSTG